MKQDAIYQLVGYDAATESLAFERDIPLGRYSEVDVLPKPESSDPGCVYG
jgi:hypothetical protein